MESISTDSDDVWCMMYRTICVVRYIAEIMECMMSVPGGDKKLYCKYCESEMYAQHSEVFSHAKRRKCASIFQFPNFLG